MTKFPTRLFSVALLLLLLGACETSDLTYQTNSVLDPSPPHVSGTASGAAKKKNFLLNANSGDGYYAVHAEYIRSTVPAFSQLPPPPGLGTPIEQDHVCGFGKNASLESYFKIADQDRFGMLLVLTRNLNAVEFEDAASGKIRLSSLKSAGIPVNFYVVRDPSSDSSKECTIDFGEYTVLDSQVFDRDETIDVMLGYARRRSDKSNIGDAVEAAAGFANLVKGVVDPGSLVFNASGLLDVEKAGKRADEIFGRVNNGVSILGEKISFDIGTTTGPTRRFVPVYFYADDDKTTEQDRRLAGLVVISVEVYSTRISAGNGFQDDGYPNFANMHIDDFPTVQKAAYKFPDFDAFAPATMKQVLMNWRSRYKQTEDQYKFSEACTAMMRIADTNFGYARIDRAAVLYEMFRGHEFFQEPIPNEPIPHPDDILGGALDPKWTANALKIAINDAEKELRETQRLKSVYGSNCFTPYLATLSRIGLGDLPDRIEAIRNRETEIENAIALLEAAYSDFIVVTPVVQAQQLLVRLNSNFMKYPPVGTGRGTEDLAAIFTEPAKYRVRVNGLNGPTDTTDRSLAELVSDFSLLQSAHIGCMSKASNPRLAQHGLGEFHFAALMLDRQDTLPNKGVYVLAGTLGAAQENGPVRINKLSVLPATGLLLSDFDTIFDDPTRECRTKQVIEKAMARLAGA